MEIRRYRIGEEEKLWRLFFDTMHQVLGPLYTKEQMERWAPVERDAEAWAKRTAEKNPFVALEKGQILGFAELEPNGHIDNFYCHQHFQRMGIGSALLHAVESEARKQNNPKLFSETNEHAVHFFKAKGFEVMEERTNMVCGAPAKQFIIQKWLSSPGGLKVW